MDDFVTATAHGNDGGFEGSDIHCCPREPGKQGQENPTWMLSSPPS